ncbi:MAG: hydroxyacylglutathione hydrolase [Paracoccaceae bacterium]
MALELVTVPCLQDNYAYLLRDPSTGVVALVDAPEEGPILAELAVRGWRLSKIMITHHHSDHVAGVTALAATSGAKVVGAAADAHRLPSLDRQLVPGDVVRIGSEAGVVIDAPGHTVGHIAFHFPDSGLVFTGDSLMAAGCGRLFEGTPAQMWTTLSTLSALPPGTLVCSGHEYTTGNLAFAATLEPGNPALTSRIARVAEARQMGRPTVPSRLSDELATNPFLRAGLPEMKAAIGMSGAPDAEVFAEIRARKDRF